MACIDLIRHLQAIAAACPLPYATTMNPNTAPSVLIVDDVPEDRALLRVLLSWHGYRLREAQDGVEALAHIAEERPGLVITAALMPRMDGFDLARRIATDATLSSVRVLFYSDNQTEVMQLGRQLGVVGVIAKPGDPATLLHSVEQALATQTVAEPLSDEVFQYEHLRTITEIAGRAHTEKRLLVERVRALQQFGAELLACESSVDVARILCTTARDMVLAVDVAVGLYSTDCNTRGVIVRATVGGDIFQTYGFVRSVGEPDGASEKSKTIAPMLGMPDDGASTLSLPLDTPSVRHGWICVAGKVGESSFSRADVDIIAALARLASIAFESRDRLDHLVARAGDLAREVQFRQQAEEWMHLALDAAHAGVAEFDIERQEFTIDPTAAQPLSVDGRFPKRLEDLLAMTMPDDRPRVAEIVRRCMEAGHAVVEFRIADAAGSVRWIEGQMRLIRDKNGAPLKIIGVSTDITERKTMEQQLRDSQKLESIGQLAGGVAHDFNNMLTAIIGYGQLLDEQVTGAAKNDVKEILRAADRAAAMTKQLLAFSRRQVLQAAVVDLVALIDSMAPMLRRLIDADVILEVKHGQTPVRALVDPTQVEQVVMNLAANARDAMPRGGHLTIELEEAELDASYCKGHAGARQGRYAVVAVRDTGAGMDAETMRHIFEPFFTTKPQGKGTGLGLATVYGIAKQSGGHVWVYSEPGQGSVFKVYFPVSDSAEAPAAETAPHPPRGGSETILLAEDEPAVRDLARGTLERLGYDVLEAGDGRQALQLASDCGRSIDLLLTDVVMPLISGPDLYQSLVQATPGLKVVYMSGYPGSAVVAHGLPSPAPWLEKPFTANGLAQRVRAVLDGGAL